LSGSSSDDGSDAEEEEEEEEEKRDTMSKLAAKSGEKVNKREKNGAPERSLRTVEEGRAGGRAGGLRAEMAELRAQVGDVASAPVGRETLREFFGRTGAYWSSEVVREWRERTSGEEERISGGGIMSEKEVKREAFRLAEERYNSLLPLLSRLSELDEQQTEQETATGSSSGAGGRRSSRR
jgi:hypothetical protein